MGTAKAMEIRPLKAADARKVIQTLHYSGKTVANSQCHFGVFLNGRCGGALQFGPSMDKRKLMGLVDGTKWNEFIELNRMALADWLPRNGESRAIAICLRMLRKQYPWLKWVVSFADGTQCGDGTIYRASGFLLTGIVENSTLYEFPNGERVSNLGIKTGFAWQKARWGREYRGEAALRKAKAEGAKPLKGYQLRYIYLFDQALRDKLTVPVLPYSAIRELGASMYKGQPSVTSLDSEATAHQAGEGGANPTVTL